MPSGTRIDPYGQFNFLVEIDGVTTAGFSEVSGLTSDTNVIEYREGDEALPATVRKLPGLIKFTNIVFKRGYTADTTLWTWRQTVLNGTPQRTTGTVTLLDEARKPVLSWQFTQAWPQKLEGPGMNGKTSEVAVETLEIVYEGLELIAVS
ncbi:MAG: phage tail protein [Candidatus Sulfotelmatobacter sp.]